MEAVRSFTAQDPRHHGSCSLTGKAHIKCNTDLQIKLKFLSYSIRPLQVLKNPVVFMVMVGILGHFALGQQIPAVLSEFIDGLANSFGGAALFYLGLTMVPLTLLVTSFTCSYFIMCMNVTESVKFDQSLSVAVAGWPAKKTNPGHWSCLDSPHHSQTVSERPFLCSFSLCGNEIIFTNVKKMSVFHDDLCFFGVQVGDAAGL